MKKLLVFSMCLMMALPLMAELKVTYLKGSVEILRDGIWQDAQTGMELELEDIVKANEDSRAILLMDQKTRIWVKAGAEMEVKSTGEESFFGLLMGKIRAKVKLLKGNKFKIRTPVSVCSVRGTDFVLSHEGDLAVIEGIVEYSDIDMTQTLEVEQGHATSASEEGGVETPHEMTAEESAEVTGAWETFEAAEEAGEGDQGAAPPAAPGEGEGEGEGEEEAQAEETPQEPQAPIAPSQEDIALQLNELRQELIEVVSEVKQEIEQQREITNEMKDSDRTAERFLRDIHGNSVQVEQHLFRPDKRTFQVLNLTKRDSYRYSDRTGWGYNGPTGSRMDVSEATIEMNMDLPESISDWSGFISDHKDTIFARKVKTKISNQVDEIRFENEWAYKDEPDKKGDLYINNWKVDQDFDPEDSDNEIEAIYKDDWSQDGEEANSLWFHGISDEMRVYKDINGNGIFDPNVDTEKRVRMGNEFYVIDNNSSIYSDDYFKDRDVFAESDSESSSMFSFMDNVAAEQIIFCREVSNNSFADSTDLLSKGNLDLVYIPDIMVNVAIDMGPGLADLADEIKSDD